MSVSTIAVAFSILGLFFLVFINLNHLLSTWDKQIQLIVYLDDGTSKKNSILLEKMYKANEEIESFSFVSKDEAWKNFKNNFSSKSEFIKFLDFNPLPSSYVIKFKNSSNRFKNIRTFAEKLKQKEGVESLEYGEKWISRFEKFMIFLRVFILCLGLILCAGLALIISNTIKLSIYSRQDEIDLMLMLGATFRFIKTPLLLEGLTQGVVGICIGLCVVKLTHFYMLYQFKGSLESIFRGIDFQFLTTPFLFAMIFASIFISFIGSLIAINQFVHSKNRR